MPLMRMLGNRMAEMKKGVASLRVHLFRKVKAYVFECVRACVCVRRGRGVWVGECVGGG